MNTKIHFFFALLASVTLTACNNTGFVIESAKGKTSHKAGEDCLSCHSSGDDGVFSTAGTVYKPDGSAQTDATINLYVSGTNTISATLVTDDSGNFYTTKSIDGLSADGDGVEVEVVGPTETGTMDSAITNGSCSACHGQDAGTVIVD